MGDKRAGGPGKGEEKEASCPLHDPENIEHHDAKGDANKPVEIRDDPKAGLVPPTPMMQHVLVDQEPGKQAVTHLFGQRDYLRDPNFASKLIGQGHPGDTLPNFGGIGRA